MKRHRHLPGLLALILFSVLLSGCAALRVKVRSTPAGEESALRSVAAQEEPTSPPYVGWLDYSRRADLSPEARLQAWLETARAAFPDAWNGNAEARKVYDAAVREVVEAWKALAWRSLSLPALPGENRLRSLAVQTAGMETVRPESAEELIPSSQIEVRGLLQRSATKGFGVPYAARFRKDDPALANQPGMPDMGMVFPLNATLIFQNDRAILRFVDTSRIRNMTRSGRSLPLASDESAALALLIARGENRLIDLNALFFTKQHIQNARLFQFQPYDPDKIPVVFVHGLMSRPATWIQALNGLLADPVIRDRYQFWFYLYPTGLPVWKSTAVLRSELMRFDQELGRKGPAHLREKVLIGHSMGGLISSLLIREGGEPLWRQFSDEHFQELDLPPKARAQIEEVIFFSPRRDVSRVIFVATPHRGSPIALRPIAGFFANLIRMPSFLSKKDRQLVVQAVRDDMRSALVAPANSIRFLRANSPLLLSILNLPLHRDIPIHTIVGDRGRGGPLEHSSDGVVPYWSSHLDQAVTEKVVPSGHGANEHPSGVEEIRRILHEAVAPSSR